MNQDLISVQNALREIIDFCTQESEVPQTYRSTNSMLEIKANISREFIYTCDLLMRDLESFQVEMTLVEACNQKLSQQEEFEKLKQDLFEDIRLVLGRTKSLFTAFEAFKRGALSLQENINI